MKRKFVIENEEANFTITRKKYELTNMEVFTNKDFENGAILLGNMPYDFMTDDTNTKKMKVVAVIPYDEKLNEEIIIKNQRIYAEELNSEYDDVLIVKPFAADKILEDAVMYSEDRFFKDFNNNVRFAVASFIAAGIDDMNEVFILCRRNFNAGTVTFKGIVYNKTGDSRKYLSDRKNYRGFNRMSIPEFIDEQNILGYRAYDISNEKNGLSEEPEKKENKEVLVDLGIETKLLKQIKDFVKNVSYKEFKDEIAKSIIGQEEANKITFAAYVYLERIAGQKCENVNDMLALAGPSGSGKTELYRTLKSYFKKHIPGLPVLIVDGSQLTEAGFKGKNIDALFEDLITARTNGVALMFVDEIDKKLMPSYDSNGKDVNRTAMHSFLTVVEGTMLKNINTGNTFFVVMGSFDELRENKKKVKATVGFGADHKDKDEIHLMELTTDHLLEAGAIPEFVGRISEVVNYQPLSAESKMLIVEKLLGNELSNWQGEFEVSDAFKKEVVASFDPKYGCRSFRNLIKITINKAVRAIYTEGLDLSNTKVVINGTKDVSFETNMINE